MNMQAPFIPDSAPFNPAQRAWLNGFFAGVFSTQPANNGLPANGHPSLLPAEEEDFPWHDASIVLEDRLKLAESQPVERKLMAAMAQLDCGACGYFCQTYGEAIARGQEKDLTRCVPGGSDTAKALKRLVSLELAGTSSGSNNGNSNGHHSGSAAKDNGVAAPAARYDRNHPCTAKLAEVTRLTHPDAPKDTRHVVIDLGDSGLTYEPGDALGICPSNCPDLVTAVLKQLGLSGNEPVTSAGSAKPLLEALATDFALNRARPDLLALLERHATNANERNELITIIDSDEHPLTGADVAEVLERFPSARPPLEQFLTALGKLQPRLYSISSSLRASPGQVHLTVGVVRYEALGRWRNGVASHFLGVRSNAGDAVRVFVQPSKFRLPADPATPIIMVGPGTGIAPFRAFLQEREAIGVKGPAWLFFGNQYIDLDFLYREELSGYLDRRVLTRLELAFSRDTAEKIYVQTRMRENAAELWSWLEAGAHFYVCGDARRMAPDVESALLDVISQHGRLSHEEAKTYLKSLVKAKRYHKDVY